MRSCIPRRVAGVSNAAGDGSDVLNELERIRLEQAKTNELLRQILVPLAFISSCCSVMLDHVQRLAASCRTAVVLLEDCSRALRAVLLNTSSMAAVLNAATAAAALEGLMYEHAVHVARGMNLAVAACLMAGVTVGMPYRWRACRAPPLPLALPGDRPWWRWDLTGGWGRPAGGGGQGGGVWGPTGLVAALTTPFNGGGGGGSSSGARTESLWRSASWVQPGAQVGAAAAAGAGAGGWWFKSGSGGGGWWWGWWRWGWLWAGVGAREGSVLVCRTRLSGGFLAGALILMLWIAVWWWYLAAAAARRRQAPAVKTAAAAAVTSGGGAESSSSSSSRIFPLRTLISGVLNPVQQPQQRHSQPALQLSLNGAPSASLAAAAAAGRNGSWQRWLPGGDGAATAAPPVAAMWRRSAALILIHSPAWMLALTAMGGSPAAWLALQLTWHAVLPYAIMALAATAAAAAEDLAVGRASKRASRCDDALLAGTHARMYGSMYGVELHGDKLPGGEETQRGRGCGAVTLAAGTAAERFGSPCDSGPAAAAAAADGGAADKAWTAAEAAEGHRGGGGGGGSRALGFGFFGGLRSRLGYRRSQQLRTHRRSSGNCTTGVLAAAAASAAATSPAKSKATAVAGPERPPAPVPPLSPSRPPPSAATTTATTKATAQQLQLLRSPCRQCTTAAAAPAWMAAVLRMARPLLVALWLYGGPVLLGAAPVLPLPWLTGRLMVTMMTMTAGLACVAAVMATMSAAAAAGAAAAASLTKGSSETAAAPPSPRPAAAASATRTVAAGAASPSRPTGHAINPGAACGAKR